MRKDISEIKILIIEDDQEKSDELIEILSDLGVKLDNIFDSKYAEKAIEIIEDELPDVVLLDLKIPYSEDDEKIKIDNSNKVIKEVERINAIRTQEENSTGILIISASVKDKGVRNNFKNTPEVVDFFDKEEVTLNRDKFKKDLLKKIMQVVDRDFRHQTIIEFNDIRKIKLNKLKTIHLSLFNRINNDLLKQFEKLNNRNTNTYQVAENIISLSGRIVEDIVNIFENKEYVLPVDDDDNYNSIRTQLTKFSGREWDFNTKSYNIIDNNPIISRKTAEFARFAYQLRSEVLHSNENDSDNKKLFIKKATIEDAAISINLIIPLIQEFIKYYE